LTKEKLLDLDAEMILWEEKKRINSGQIDSLLLGCKPLFRIRRIQAEGPTGIHYAVRIKMGL